MWGPIRAVCPARLTHLSSRRRPNLAYIIFCVQAVIGPPCGVPSSTGLTNPSSITPAFKNARMSFNTRLFRHPLRHLTHQFVVIDPVEEFLEVQVHHPAITLRPDTAAPGPPPDGPSGGGGIHSCAGRTSGPSAFAEPASPPAGSIDPTPSECPTFSSRRPAWGFPPASPVAAYRSRSATVPARLANALSGSPVNA